MIIEGTRFKIMKRTGSEANGYTEEEITYLSSPTYGGAKMDLQAIADEFEKDGRFYVDWLSDSAFIVWIADEADLYIIDEGSKRYAYRIEREDFTIEI